MNAGEVVVMDVGASYQGYAADVTRTIPVERQVHARKQRAVYQLVRDAQAAAEKVAKPGASWKRGGYGAGGGGPGLATPGSDRVPGCHLRSALEGVLLQSNPASCTQAFLYMATAWGTALDSRCTTHRQPTWRGGTFEVGHVFTIEPGVYISTKLLDMLPDTPKNRAYDRQGAEGS